MERRDPPPDQEPDRRVESGNAVSQNAVDNTSRLGLADMMRIRWRHRGEEDPDVWALRVRFDELIASNDWDLATNIDELNDRYDQD